MVFKTIFKEMGISRIELTFISLKKLVKPVKTGFQRSFLWFLEKSRWISELYKDRMLEIVLSSLFYQSYLIKESLNE